VEEEKALKGKLTSPLGGLKETNSWNCWTLCIGIPKLGNSYYVDLTPIRNGANSDEEEKIGIARIYGDDVRASEVMVFYPFSEFSVNLICEREPLTISEKVKALVTDALLNNLSLS